MAVDLDFKAVLGRFCTGITAITALADDQPLGFACQSFSSLSLDPPAVALFPARTSTTWPRIREVGRFCVNILAHDQEDVCRQLGRSGQDKFADLRWRRSPNGSPLLEGSIAWIDCTLDREVDGGDHTIVVAHVTELSEQREAAPLLFYRSGYERLAVV
ncbi:NADH-FMN oxidoreductase RutF, flavin reductase (DIM6/NTAB) family [Nocardia amikacinitolerans]|uniref:flavin reductase family protein n=1 Tax=Nocardia amikacinitolerans TaxID=756689 RepID=UPI0008347E76|nr:flavin reductase family protein [Nocardia amikacinitolerans]MCP2315188.1 NADH-FMN oxidoreductase RutF, flavin reductase (DIM6/NTAB) family [Nocardia amikacinitolerans]